MKLGKLGVWTTFDEKTAAEGADTTKRIEQLGYSAVWLGEGFGRNVLTQAAWLLARTSVLNIASGIANIYGRDAMAMASAQIGLNEQSGGRFLLGIGVSHQPVVIGMRGHDYGKPVETMRNYLAAMRTVSYVAPPPAEEPRTVLAALRPKMLALSREEADGALTYNASPAHTAEARKALGPGKSLSVEQKVLLEPDPERARDAARRFLAIYLSLPNYLNNWRRLGFGDDDFSDGGSDRLIDEVVAWGDRAAIVERIEEHWEAGADHVCIQAIDPHSSKPEMAFPAIDEKLLGDLAEALA